MWPFKRRPPPRAKPFAFPEEKVEWVPPLSDQRRFPRAPSPVPRQDRRADWDPTPPNTSSDNLLTGIIAAEVVSSILDSSPSPDPSPSPDFSGGGGDFGGGGADSSY